LKLRRKAINMGELRKNSYFFGLQNEGIMGNVAFKHTISVLCLHLKFSVKMLFPVGRNTQSPNIAA
jgi:hypothetical protein